MAWIDGHEYVNPPCEQGGKSPFVGYSEDEKKGLEADRVRLNVENTAESMRRRAIASTNGQAPAS